MDRDRGQGGEGKRSVRVKRSSAASTNISLEPRALEALSVTERVGTMPHWLQTSMRICPMFSIVCRSWSSTIAIEGANICNSSVANWVEIPTISWRKTNNKSNNEYEPSQWRPLRSFQTSLRMQWWISGLSEKYFFIIVCLSSNRSTTCSLRREEELEGGGKE